MASANTHTRGCSWLERATRSASLGSATPAPARQYAHELLGDVARGTEDVGVTVTQRHIAGDGARVVPVPIAVSPLLGMPQPAVELYPGALPLIACIYPDRSGSHDADLSLGGREAVCPFDSVQVLPFQGGLDAVGNLLERGGHHGSPL